MPLGNLTSQFFANIYLNELDQFIKHKLRARYYVRYVDDFVVLHHSKKILKQYKVKINEFLDTKLHLELHPDKSTILKLCDGIGFLGFRIFFHHKLIRKKNFRKFENKFRELKKLYQNGIIGREKAIEYFEGWLAYISHANTYKYRRYLTKLFNQCFPLKPTIKINNQKKHENFIKKINQSNLQFSSQKTLQSFKKGLTIKEIAKKRNIKESTVWEHFAKLIEYNQLSVWKVLSKGKIFKISSKIHNKNDKLKDIQTRINDNLITFNEVNCVLASIKCKNRRKKKRKKNAL